MQVMHYNLLMLSYSIVVLSVEVWRKIVEQQFLFIQNDLQ